MVENPEFPEFRFKNIRFFIKEGKFFQEKSNRSIEEITEKTFHINFEKFHVWQENLRKTNDNQSKKLQYIPGKHTVLDLFSGCGGLGLGFKLSGFHIIGALDYDQFCCETYRKNFPETVVLQGDISKLNPEHLPFQKDKIDVIIGGPPCQGFSVIGRSKIKNLVEQGIWVLKNDDNTRFIDDRRNVLYKYYVDFLKYYHPKIFVMENVPGLFNFQKGKFRKQILEDFRGLGYRVNVKVLNAVEFGVPQRRKRIFFLGNRILDQKKEHIFSNIFPKPSYMLKIPERAKLLLIKEDYRKIEAFFQKSKDTELSDRNTEIKIDNNFQKKVINQRTKRKIANHQVDLFSNSLENVVFKDSILRPAVTLQDALEDLPQINAGEGTEDLPSSNYNLPTTLYQVQMRLASKAIFNHRARNLSPIDVTIFNTLKPGDIYRDLPPNLKRYGEGDDFPDKMKRLRYNQPCGTIVAHLHKDGYMFIHPEIDRTITVREAARIQSFPDRFYFTGSRSEQFKQVGNAVPPILAKAIAESIKIMLERCS